MSRNGGSSRLPPPIVVVESLENEHHDRCVDVFVRPDGSWGFEEFRRDVEDRGAWTAVAGFSARRIPSHEEALREAARAVPWLPPAGVV